VIYKSNMTVMCVLCDGAFVSVCFAVCYWQERGILDKFTEFISMFSLSLREVCVYLT